MSRLTVVFDADDPARLGAFWGGLLGRDVLDESGGVLVAGDERQVALRFAPSRDAQGRPSPLHLHVTSDTLDDQAARVATALALGASHLDVGQQPDEGHVVLADPEGNALCVIEPGNGFLAGCGPLGEIACDGMRDVGVFWSSALGWPLVWDQDEETAIQSPAGGTKVAWGGPPVTPPGDNPRQRFELDVADLDTEVARLIALGARRLDGPLLADPGGNRFLVRAAD